MEVAVSASKDRLLWAELPEHVRDRIGRLAGAPVVAAASCAGGFSPGLAARVRLADGRRAFVKAMDCTAWPAQAGMYADEARVAALLPAGLPVPEFLGCDDDPDWVILAFECVDGSEPPRPWRESDLAAVVAAAGQLADAVVPGLSRTHARLGGWADLATDDGRLTRLAACAPWAASRLDLLAGLEAHGLAAARGSSLVHFDMFAHNILLTGHRVLFVDWPHARLGAPFVDVVLLLASAVCDGIDPEPFLAGSPLTANVEPLAIDGLIAAQAGFCLRDALYPPEPGLEPIYAAKLDLGLAALDWLTRRLVAR
jgi:aminoglycoside phosphotransferase (APT) family kinase protein